jgi:hypothetical protein
VRARAFHVYIKSRKERLHLPRWDRTRTPSTATQKGTAAITPSIGLDHIPPMAAAALCLAAVAVPTEQPSRATVAPATVAPATVAPATVAPATVAPAEHDTETYCTRIAAELSAAYLSRRRFTGSNTTALQDFLASNGVLFSFCTLTKNGFIARYNITTPNCSAFYTPSPPPGLEYVPPWVTAYPDPPNTHWSGSWVNADTGFLSVDNGDGAVGVIADPHALHIRCLYPTDGATDRRQDDGCGPLVGDPVYGRDGAVRMGPARAALRRAPPPVQPCEHRRARAVLRVVRAAR